MKKVLCSMVLMASVAAQAQPLNWYKGNTHTHTNKSDGDSSPGVVARWYRDHDYDFLVLSDHNKRTEIDQLQKEISDENAAAGKKPFLLIPGEEVSDKFGNKPLHINGLNTKSEVGKQGGPSKVKTVQRCIDAIRARGGIPHLNHPNFVWALSSQDLMQLRGLRHFEIYNGHPDVNNLGGGGIPGTEAIWDMLLSSGRHFYGVAVDDAHAFTKFNRDVSNPGRGWIVVRAKALAAEDIINSFEDGQYYASTGVILDDVTSDGQTLRLTTGQRRNEKFRTEFVGRGGTVLATDETTAPAYKLKPDDLYVRARITSSRGDHAWTQPLLNPAAKP